MARDAPLSPAAAPGDAAETARLAWLILAACLFLQRLGLPFGDRAIDLVGPAGLALAGYGLLRGRFVLHRARLIAYLALVLLVLLGTIWRASVPTGLGWGSTNVNSLLQFLLLTAFATLGFATPVDEGVYFRGVAKLLLAVGIAGIAEFALQLVGLRLFAFTGILPASLLFEAGYNLQIPVGVGGLLKSNGFFLVEPSVFSQVMAIGLLLEAVAFRRAAYLAVFLAGLILSFSGTGWLVLGGFVAASALALGGRGVAIALGLVAALGVAVAGLALLAPDLLGAVADRLGEINQPGTSGHSRFITPFWLLGDVFAANPGAALLGIGAGASEQLTLPYVYAVNTPIKVLVEFGAPVLAAYALLFVLGRRSRVQAALLVPSLVLFFLAGGYQQFPPMLFFVLLLVAVPALASGPPTVSAALEKHPAAA